MTKVQGGPTRAHLRAIARCNELVDALLHTNLSNSGKWIFGWEVVRRRGKQFRLWDAVELDEFILDLPQSAHEIPVGHFVRDPVFQRGDTVRFRTVRLGGEVDLDASRIELEVFDLSPDTEPPCQSAHADKYKSNTKLSFFEYKFNYTGWKALRLSGSKPRGGSPGLVEEERIYEILLVQVLEEADFRVLAETEREGYLRVRAPRLRRQRQRAKRMRRAIELRTDQLNKGIRKGRRRVGSLELPDEERFRKMDPRTRELWEAYISYQIENIHAISREPLGDDDRWVYEASRFGETGVEVTFSRRWLHTDPTNPRQRRVMIRSFTQEYGRDELVVLDQGDGRVVVEAEDLLGAEIRKALDSLFLVLDLATVGKFALTRRAVIGLGRYLMRWQARSVQRVGNRAARAFRRRLASRMKLLRRSTSARGLRLARLRHHAAELRAAEALVRDSSRKLMETTHQALEAAVKASLKSVRDQITEPRSMTPLESESEMPSLDWARAGRDARRAVATTWRDAGLSALLRSIPAKNWYGEVVSRSAENFLKEALDRNVIVLSPGTSGSRIAPQDFDLAAWSGVRRTLEDEVEGVVVSGVLSSWIVDQVVGH